MPWCQPCGRFFNPNTVQADGTCPACGALIDDHRPARAAPAVDGDEGAVRRQAAATRSGTRPPTDTKVPWHFWVLVAAAALYLGWRAVQGLLLLF